MKTTINGISLVHRKTILNNWDDVEYVCKELDIGVEAYFQNYPKPNDPPNVGYKFPIIITITPNNLHERYGDKFLKFRLSHQGSKGDGTFNDDYDVGVVNLDAFIEEKMEYFI